MENEDTYFGTEKEDLKQEMEDLKKKETSQLELVWLRFKRNKLALLGAAFLMGLILVAILAPFIAPYSPNETDVYNKRAPPSSEHLLGTDQLGRDTLSRLIFGSRVALLVGLLIVSVSGGIGITLGLLAGSFGGWVDEVIMRLVDTFMAFPVIIFGMAMASALGFGLYPVIIAVGFIVWTRFARVTRGEVLSIRQETFIESAKSVGESKWSIIFRYIFPNVLPSIVVVATIQMPTAILYSAALNFLGIGVQKPTPSWGSMVSDGSAFMQFHPTLVTVAGIAIVITVLAFNLVGDGLRDALDPVRRGGS